MLHTSQYFRERRIRRAQFLKRTAQLGEESTRFYELVGKNVNEQDVGGLIENVRPFIEKCEKEYKEAMETSDELRMLMAVFEVATFVKWFQAAKANLVQKNQTWETDQTIKSIDNMVNNLKKIVASF